MEVGDIFCHTPGTIKQYASGKSAGSQVHASGSVLGLWRQTPGLCNLEKYTCLSELVSPSINGKKLDIISLGGYEN